MPVLFMCACSTGGESVCESARMDSQRCCLIVCVCESTGCRIVRFAYLLLIQYCYPGQVLWCFLSSGESGRVGKVVWV